MVRVSRDLFQDSVRECNLGDVVSYIHRDHDGNSDEVPSRPKNSKQVYNS